MTVIEPVWVEFDTPGRGYDARNRTRYCALNVTDGRVTLADAKGEIDLSGIESLKIGKFGRDPMNKWIEITFSASSTVRHLYINDGRWRGWRPILTTSNRQILKILENCVTASTD